MFVPLSFLLSLPRRLFSLYKFFDLTAASPESISLGQVLARAYRETEKLKVSDREKRSERRNAGPSFINWRVWS